MNQYQQFRTFANSSQNIKHTFPNNEESDQSSHQETQNRENKSKKSRKTHRNKKHGDSRSSKSIHFKCPNQISLMLSDVSFFGIQNQKDVPLELLTLQVEVTQQLLAMKEDKLTLLEQFNKSLGYRFQVERQIVKLKKRNEEKERQSIETGLAAEGQMWLTEGNSTQQYTSSPLHPIITKNQQLQEEYNSMKHSKKQSLQSTDREIYEKQIQEIENLKEKSYRIENQLQKMQEKFQKINEQRFQTFFPNQKNKKPQPPPSNSNHEQLMRLKAERDALYHKVVNANPNYQANYFLLDLIQQNKELQVQADSLILNKRKGSSISKVQNSVADLRKKIQEEQSSKKLFFEDLKKFKRQMESLRSQNSQLARRAFV